MSSLHALQQTAPPEITTVTLGQRSFKIRRPTGRDQLTWLTQSTGNSGLQAIIQSLVVSPISPDDFVSSDDFVPANHSISDNNQWPEKVEESALANLNQALDALDPLVDFTLLITCPHCNQAAQHSLDLGGWALKQLQHMQQQLMLLVHTLAYHYHWSEAEIFAIPHWRRKYYLSLIAYEERR